MLHAAQAAATAGLMICTCTAPASKTRQEPGPAQPRAQSNEDTSPVARPRNCLATHTAPFSPIFRGSFGNIFHTRRLNPLGVSNNTPQNRPVSAALQARPPQPPLQKQRILCSIAAAAATTTTVLFSGTSHCIWRPHGATSPNISRRSMESCGPQRMYRKINTAPQPPPGGATAPRLPPATPAVATRKGGYVLMWARSKLGRSGAAATAHNTGCEHKGTQPPAKSKPPMVMQPSREQLITCSIPFNIIT